MEGFRKRERGDWVEFMMMRLKLRGFGTCRAEDEIFMSFEIYSSWFLR